MTAHTTTAAIQTFSVATSLLASGGIATMTLFDVPELQAQPASRSLPSIRWLFSRGSHIMPQAALLSSAGFAYLSVNAMPAGQRTIGQFVSLAANHPKVRGYLAAAVLAMSIAPFTTMVMIPTNFKLIKMNEERGGTRSAKSAEAKTVNPGERSALDSVYSKGEASEFTDLSGPQAATSVETTEEEDREVRELLGKFGKMNAVRAILLGAGGIAGLWTALI